MQRAERTTGLTAADQPEPIRRLLNPKDGNVTIATLQRAAKIVGRTLRIELL